MRTSQAKRMTTQDMIIIDLPLPVFYPNRDLLPKFDPNQPHTLHIPYPKPPTCFMSVARTISITILRKQALV